MMSAIRVTVMIAPVSAPASAATAIRSTAKANASRVDMSTMYFAESTFMRPISDPTDRSMRPR